MASINKKANTPRFTTHGGGPGFIPGAEEQLKRSIMACMLWEDNFYEDGRTLAQRIEELAGSVTAAKLAAIAIYAKYDQKIRHAPLLLAVAMARLGVLRAETLRDLIRRPDEIGEFLSLYWKDGKCPLSKQVKKGLADAFLKFDEYQFAKYDRAEEIKIRDVLFLVHAKPDTAARAELFRKIIDGTLATPDTWEVAISAAKSKQEKALQWSRLIDQKKLGPQAFLMNLRNMREAGVAISEITRGLEALDYSKILPMQFLSAAAHNPGIEEAIDCAFMSCSGSQRRLRGKTVVIIDVSGSMYGSKVSNKSEIDRAKAACALAAIARERCEEVAIFATAGNDHTRIHKTARVPARHGFGLVDAIYAMSTPLGGGGIFLQQVLRYVKAAVGTADRILVVTDEQDCSGGQEASNEDFFGRFNYILNVGTYDRGIAYRTKAVHISGWSEKVLDYIEAFEGAR